MFLFDVTDFRNYSTYVKAYKHVPNWHLDLTRAVSAKPFKDRKESAFHCKKSFTIPFGGSKAQ
jgi:hypothetical protein